MALFSAKAIVAAIIGSGGAVGGGFGLHEIVRINKRVAQEDSQFKAKDRDNSRSGSPGTGTSEKIQNSPSASNPLVIISEEKAASGISTWESESSPKGGWIVTKEDRPQYPEIEDGEEDDEDSDEAEDQEISGKLVLVKGEDFSVNSGYSLKVYYTDDSSSIEGASLYEIDIKGPKSKINSYISKFTRDAWMNSDKLEDFLKVVEGKQTEFHNIFKSNVYEQLLQKLRELAKK